MRKLLFLSITFFLSIISLSISQTIEITGVVKDETNYPLPGAKVSVKNTEIKTSTDFDGNFRISIPDSLNVLVFQFLGFSTLEYKLKQNQNYVEIKLGENYYTDNWYSLGFNIDPLNALFGLKISNGFEELPLIHFEDINSTLIYLASFQTNFKSDYAIDLKLKLSKTRLFNKTSLQFQQKELQSIDLFFRKLDLSKEFYIRSLHFILIPSIGFQEFNDFQNLGFRLGIQNEYDSFYFGASTGYYFDYFTYSVYFHGFLFNLNWGCRLEYERLYNQDFLTFGIQYSFIKEKLRKEFRN